MAAAQPHDRLVLGRYRLGGVIGRGGAATVHRAHDVRTGEQVAVKEIPVGLDMARRAGAEVRAASRLEHPNVVALRDFGEDHDACYLVTELVDGEPLGAMLADRDGRDRDVAALTAVADVLDGLAHAHGRGVVHRDVKPANILVDRSGRARLADFGIARIAGEAGLTTTGGLVGTVAYMAPEQASGDPTGPAADVYSACLVLYEALTGRNPVAGSSPGDTLRRAANGVIAPIGERRPDLPAALCRAIDDALSATPETRPAPGWLAAVLRAQLPGLRATMPARRVSRRAAAVLSGAAAAAIAAVLLHRVSGWGPGTTAAAAAAAGAAVAVAPWPALLAGWVAAMVALGTAAPGTAMVVGAAGLVALAPIRRRGRLGLLPAAAPILCGLGIAPVASAAAGAVRRWAVRLWAVCASMAAALVWQVIAGADPALDGRRLTGVWEELRGVVSPVEALTTIVAPVQARPSLAVAAGALALGGLAVPLLRRARRGLPRALAAIGWTGAMIVAVAAAGGSAEAVAGAFIPGGILVAAWSAAPWRRLRRGTDRRATVTLPAGTVERLPAA